MKLQDSLLKMDQMQKKKKKKIFQLVFFNFKSFKNHSYLGRERGIEGIEVLNYILEFNRVMLKIQY